MVDLLALNEEVLQLNELFQGLVVTFISVVKDKTQQQSGVLPEENQLLGGVGLHEEGLHV